MHFYDFVSHLGAILWVMKGRVEIAKINMVYFEICFQIVRQNVCPNKQCGIDSQEFLQEKIMWLGCIQKLQLKLHIVVLCMAQLTESSVIRDT